LLEIILDNANSKFRNSCDIESSSEIDKESTILQEVHYIYSEENNNYTVLVFVVWHLSSLYFTATMKPKSPNAIDNVPENTKQIKRKASRKRLKKVCYRNGKENIPFTSIPSAPEILDIVFGVKIWAVSSRKRMFFIVNIFNLNLKVPYFLF
jgi:hypothetical protein